MKKTTFLFSGCLVGLAAFQTDSLKAQISIITTDIASIGQTFAVANDSNATGAITPGNSGISVTWSYPSLRDTTTDTIKAITPTGTYSVVFPGSNLELTYSLGTTKEAFLANDAGRLVLYGAIILYNAHLYPVVYRPNPEEIYPFPLTYADTNSGGYSYRIQVPFADSIYDSLRIQALVTYKDTVDAFGICTTPYGTKNVLRHREIDRSLDSTFAKDTIIGKWVYIPHSRTLTADTDYSWLADSIGYPMLSMHMKTGKVQYASWVKKPSSSGIDEITDKAGSLVYPNPASTVLNIKLASCRNGSVSIMDMAGREISTTAFSNQLANINTSELPAGMYFYRITDKTGNFIDAGKFTVVR